MSRHFGWESFAFGFSPRGFFWAGPRRRRRQWFESGDMKYVILKLLNEKPRHGYEVMKELEDRLRGCYSPSPGTVYPTLQWLVDLLSGHVVGRGRKEGLRDHGRRADVPRRAQGRRGRDFRAGTRHRGAGAGRRDGGHEPRRGAAGEGGVPRGVALAGRGHTQAHRRAAGEDAGGDR